MILDRYVVRTFITAFVGALLSLVGLFVVVDAMERLDELIEAGIVRALEVYVYQMPLILGQVIPIVTMAAAVFTVLSFQRRNELWAMVSAGVSVYRAILPVLVIGFFLTVSLWANQEWVVPKVAPRLISSTKELFGGRKFSYYDVLVQDSEGRLFWMGSYDFAEKTMSDVAVLEFYPGSSPKVYYRARSADYQGSGPGGWLLRDYTKLYFLTGGERDTSQGVGGREDGREVLVETDLTPSAIGAKQLEAPFMGILQARRLLEERPDLGGLRVAFHSKISFPVSTLVLLLIGVPSALRWGGRSYLLGAGVGLLISFFFLGCFLGSVELGNRGELPAVIAAWFPVSAFGALGLYLFTGIRT